MPTTITSTQVVTDFGAYYIDSGQSESNIHDTLRENFEASNAFTVIHSDDTVLREINVEYAEVLQAFQTAFTPKGGVTFTPKQIPLFNVKMDQLFYPDALKNQYLAFLTSNNLDRTTWPFVRWFIEKYALAQIMHDLVKNIYGAKRVNPTPGTAGAASAAFDGIKTIINARITGGTISTITTGAPSTTPETFATQIETFIKSVPELYWEIPLEVNTSRALALRYREGRRIKYNSNYAQVSDAIAVQDFEQVKVVGRGGMTGVTKIWATPKNNAILAFKGAENMQTVEVEKVDRQVKVYTDFWIGLGFIQDSLVWTNDQDLT